MQIMEKSYDRKLSEKNYLSVLILQIVSLHCFFFQYTSALVCLPARMAIPDSTVWIAIGANLDLVRLLFSLSSLPLIPLLLRSISNPRSPKAQIKLLQDFR